MRKICLTVIGLFVTVVFACPAESGVITDMFGRRFAIPDCPRKVYSASPPDTYLLYAIDPAMLAGLNFPLKEKDRKYMQKCIFKLPIVGGTFGQASTPNMEMLLRVDPEVVVVSNDETALSVKVNETMRIVNAPVVEMTLRRLSDYPEAFLRMGRILGRESRARQLSDYSRRTLSEAAGIVAKLPPDNKVSVYYAEGPDGLITECDDSRHTEPVSLAGGLNVHRCKARDLYGMEKVSLEQVIVYDPDVILVMDKGFFRSLFKDPRWRQLRAVKEKRVYLVPDQPINWFDRPPTFMRFIGLKWIMNRLYPKEYPIDIVKEARDFYRLFLGVNVSDAEMSRIVLGR